MKTKQRNLAEIASDVRKATKERATEEVTAEIALKREMYKEVRAHVRANKEKLADFYYKIALLFLTSSAIPCLSIFIRNEKLIINWHYVGLGLVACTFFALLASYILKEKNYERI